MTPEEFKTTPFVYGMKVLYKGEEREVFAVNFTAGKITFEDKRSWLKFDEKHFSEVELIKGK